MSSLKPIRLILLGAPGSGKGTLTSRLLKQLPQVNSLSTGDLLRNETKNKDSEIGQLANSYISKGNLLPDSLMIDLLTKELTSKSWLNKESSFLLDGFPRTGNQASLLDKTLSNAGLDINLVVELDVPPEIILNRISNRWCHTSGRIYNLEYNPPKVPFKDDVTGEPLFQRSDDNPETFKIRLDNYFKELQPIKDFYTDKKVYENVSGETSDIIFPKLLSLVTNKFS